MLVLPEKPINSFLSPFYHTVNMIISIEIRRLLTDTTNIHFSKWRKGDEKEFIGFSGRTKLIL